LDKCCAFTHENTKSNIENYKKNIDQNSNITRSIKMNSNHDQRSVLNTEEFPVLIGSKFEKNISGEKVNFFYKLNHAVLLMRNLQLMR